MGWVYSYIILAKYTIKPTVVCWNIRIIRKLNVHIQDKNSAPTGPSSPVKMSKSPTDKDQGHCAAARLTNGFIIC